MWFLLEKKSLEAQYLTETTTFGFFTGTVHNNKAYYERVNKLLKTKTDINLNHKVWNDNNTYLGFISVNLPSSFIYLTYALNLYSCIMMFTGCLVFIFEAHFVLLKWPNFSTVIVKVPSDLIQCICFNFWHSCWLDLHIIV